MYDACIRTSPRGKRFIHFIVLRGEENAKKTKSTIIILSRYTYWIILCRTEGHYNIAADTAEESAKSVYINRISMFGRCSDGHYVVDLEFKCIKCEALRTISKHGPEEGVRVKLPSLVI
jgi:hypothetical protein